MKYIIPEEPSENPDRIKMWKHYCNVEDSLMEIWERRRISDEKHEDSIPLRETTRIKRNRETIVDNKSPSIKDALSILQNTEKIISNIGLNVDETSKVTKK